MKIEDVFKRVRTEVRSKSNGSQIPEERSSLEGDFYFSRGSMVVEEPPTAAAVREPETGKLTVKSNVGGAKVYINRADRGVEPVSATLNPGEYSIILKKEGYSDAFDTVRVEAGSAKTINIVMEITALPPVATNKTGDAYLDSTTGMEFVFVKGGCYQMGDTFGDGQADEKPVHNVCVSDFYMGKYEVMQGQWQSVMRSNPSNFKNCGTNCPVEQVSWNDAQDFIGRLNGKAGKNYRLPTEAEWEYAARSGGKWEKYAGGDELDRVAWYSSNSGSTTHSVGTKAPNGLGLYDMSGNVWEWCQDWYGEKFYGESPRDNPPGPSSGWHHLLRGGSWGNVPGNVRAADRDRGAPALRLTSFGFRLSFSASPETSTDLKNKESELQSSVETGRDGRFIAYSNGTVSDTRTGLMWAASDNGSDINWANAKNYCENYRGGGYSDWRMPTQDELAGLYDARKSYKVTQRDYNVKLTEMIQLSSCCPWASETRGSEAAGFGFTGGRWDWSLQSNYYYTRALPVRSGK